MYRTVAVLVIVLVLPWLLFLYSDIQSLDKQGGNIAKLRPAPALAHLDVIVKKIKNIVTRKEEQYGLQFILSYNTSTEIKVRDKSIYNI